MKQFASGNHPNSNAKAMFDDCVDNVQLWDLSCLLYTSDAADE